MSDDVVKPSDVIAWLEESAPDTGDEETAAEIRSYAECIRSLEAREARYREALVQIAYEPHWRDMFDMIEAARRALTEPTNTQEQET